MLLEGKYINLRSIEHDDLKTLGRWRNRKHVRRTTREYRLLNMVNQTGWFESVQKQNPPKDIIFGIVNKKGTLIGFTGLTYIDWKNRNSEISMYFAKPNWQKTKEAQDTMKVLMEYSFDELHLHRLYAEIFSIAKENIDFYESMKFLREGKLRHRVWREGKWWNSYVYSKLSDEYYEES